MKVLYRDEFENLAVMQVSKAAYHEEEGLSLIHISEPTRPY